ncbi:MAG: hypothetical protein V4732_06560 [Pseudomonadota bacterium]
MKRKFIGELTSSDKMFIYCLLWLMAFIPAIYFNSRLLAFTTLGLFNLWILAILLRNMYYGFASVSWTKTPIKTISSDIEDAGDLTQKKIQLTVTYEYDFRFKAFKNHKIRYPFWSVTDNKKIALHTEIKSGNVIFCYVNPKKNHQASLLKGFEPSDIPWYVIYLAFTFFSIIIYLIKT